MILFNTSYTRVGFSIITSENNLGWLEMAKHHSSKDGIDTYIQFREKYSFNGKFGG